jgi:ribosomal-protein-alanine N-acetyltransferase
MRRKCAGHEASGLLPMTTEIISTVRLSLRSPAEADLDALHERVFSDTDVMRFVLGGVPFTRDRSTEFFALAFDHDKTGLKLGVLVEKESSEIVGFAGLMECRILDQHEYEIGFVMSRSAWGKGYATEIGYGQLSYGFNVVGCARLLAQVAPDNAGSIATLEKIGMAFHSNIQSQARGLRRVYVMHRSA